MHFPMIDDLLAMSPTQLELPRRRELLAICAMHLENELARVVGMVDPSNTLEGSFAHDQEVELLGLLSMIYYALDPQDMQRVKEFRFFFDRNEHVYHLLAVEDFEYDRATHLPGKCFFTQEEADELGRRFTYGQLHLCMCHLNVDDEEEQDKHIHIVTYGDDICG